MSNFSIVLHVRPSGMSTFDSSRASLATSEPSWDGLQYDYWKLAARAKALDPSGVREYELAWMGPDYQPRTQTGSYRAILFTEGHSADYAYCCTALLYGATIRCPNGIDLVMQNKSQRIGTKYPSSRGIAHPLPRHGRGLSGIAGEWDLVLNLHEISAHRSHNAMMTAPGLHVVRTMEPPGYNSQLRTNSHEFMRSFDLSEGFLDRPSERHVPEPYVLLRDLHHIYSPLRLSFAERTENASALAMVSNCGWGGRFPRARLLRALIDRFSVDSIGSCHKNRAKTFTGRSATCTSPFSYCVDEMEMMHLGKYKLLLAFENSVCDGYITEKMMRAYRIQAVPVVVERQVGDHMLPGYQHFFPKHSYINAASFKTITALVDHLKAVSTNESLWMSYMRHRVGARALAHAQRRYRKQFGLPVCRLAQRGLQLKNAGPDGQPAKLAAITCDNTWPFQGSD